MQYHTSHKKAISKGETKIYLRTNSNETNFKNMTTNLIHKLISTMTTVTHTRHMQGCPDFIS